jgi:hypothetical protein
MKTRVALSIFLFVLCLFVIPSKSYAQKMPIYSANGFECAGTKLKGSDLKLVTCEGSFPKDSGNLTASGYASVSLTYGKGGNVYSYTSLTGCLMHATSKGITATNRSGKKQKFPMGAFDEAGAFCSK